MYHSNFGFFNCRNNDYGISNFSPNPKASLSLNYNIFLENMQVGTKTGSLAMQFWNGPETHSCFCVVPLHVSLGSEKIWKQRRKINTIIFSRSSIKDFCFPRDIECHLWPAMVNLKYLSHDPLSFCAT